MIPRTKTLNCSNAPPLNILYRLSSVPCVSAKNSESAILSTPGAGINIPSLYTESKARVNSILLRRSGRRSIETMLSNTGYPSWVRTREPKRLSSMLTSPPAERISFFARSEIFATLIFSALLQDPPPTTQTPKYGRS